MPFRPQRLTVWYNPNAYAKGFLDERVVATSDPRSDHGWGPMAITIGLFALAWSLWRATRRRIT